MNSRIKRLIAGAAAATTVASSLVAFGATGASIAGASTHYTIDYNVGAASDPFFLTMEAGAKAEAHKLGVTLNWQGDPTNYSPTTQLPILSTQINQHPNAIVIAPTDTQALETTIASAVNSGIKVLNVDSGDANQSNITSWVTGNNVNGGTVAADALAKALHYSTACGSGKCYVAIGVSSISTSTDAARLKGFKNEIKAKYPKIHVLNALVSNSQPSVAEQNFTQAINSNNGHHLGIFAIDGTDLQGALSAEGGKSLPVVGYDAYSTNVAQMIAGKVAAIVSQQPYLEGQLAIKYAVAALEGHKVPHLQTLANEVLTPQTPLSTISKYQYKIG